MSDPEKRRSIDKQRFWVSIGLWSFGVIVMFGSYAVGKYLGIERASNVGTGVGLTISITALAMGNRDWAWNIFFDTDD